MKIRVTLIRKNGDKIYEQFIDPLAGTTKLRWSPHPIVFDNGLHELTEITLTPTVRVPAAAAKPEG